MTTSTVPAALSALVTLLTAATDPTTTEIIDGPVTTSPPSKYVCIGWDGDSTTGVVFRQVAAAMRGPGNHARRENYDVLCYLNVTTGDEDISLVRDAAFDLLGEVETLLRSNITLGGVLGSGGTAQLSEGQMAQGSSESGLTVEMSFQITCTARL